jgi:hypothetical protein
MCTSDETLLTVQTPLASAIAWAALSLFTLAGFFSLLVREYAVAAGFGVFLLMAIQLVLIVGRVGVSDDHIQCRTIAGTFAIRWDELHAVSYSAGTLTLSGAGKSLSVPSYEFWTGSNRGVALELAAAKLTERGITIRHRFFVWPLSCKTRVRQ